VILGASLDPIGYRGFTSTVLSRWRAEYDLIVECDGAQTHFSMTRRELMECESLDSAIGLRIIESCERLWSRWMAL
jgi:hypothetical protein